MSKLEDYIEDASWTCLEAAVVEKPEYAQLMLKCKHSAQGKTIVFTAALDKAQASRLGVKLAAWGHSTQD